MPVPSFLKALYISSWDTIFDEDYIDPMQTISLGDSNTNQTRSFRSPHVQTSESNQGLSAPEALKIRMHELTARSKSSLGLTPTTSQPIKDD